VMAAPLRAARNPRRCCSRGAILSARLRGTP
jgi:hypothetical protein